MRAAHRVLLLAVLSSALVTPSFAFQGRPLSDLVIEDRMVACVVSAAASDGDDFLVVCDLRHEGTWGQIISGDGTGGPLFLIGRGEGNGGTYAVWNGSSYLVTWCSANNNGKYLTRVSRNGSVSEPTLINNAGCGGSLFASGDRVLLVTGRSSSGQPGLLGTLLDGDGRPASSPKVLFAGSLSSYDIAATNNGFALGTFGYQATSLTRIDRDGNPQGAPIVVEGPYGTMSTDYHSVTGVVASDGENVLLAFHGYQSGKRSELRTAIVAADSTLERAPKSIFAITGPFSKVAITPTSILWNGSAYIAGMAVIHEEVNRDAVWLRINRHGERAGDVPVLARAYTHVALASNGRENLVAFTATRQPGVTLEGPSYALAAPDTLTPLTAFLPVGLSPGPHAEVAIGAMRDQYLAAWTEKHGDTWQVRASRVDRDGRYLDGPGIVLGTVGLEHSIAVDSDGTNWLVVWGNGTVYQSGTLRAMRISSSGTLLDTQPIALGRGEEATVRWGNGSWMVVATSIGSLVTIPVGPDGIAGARRVIGEAALLASGTDVDPIRTYTSPFAAFDGNGFLAGAIHHAEFDAGAIQSYWFDDMTVRMTRVDANGVAVEGPPSFVSDSDWPRLALATNGASSLAVLLKAGKLIGILLPERTEIQIAESDGLVATTWDGHDFVVAYKSPAKTGLSLIRVSPQGVVSEAVDTNFAADERLLDIALAGGNDVPPLLGFVARHTRWNGVARSSAAFLAEVAARDVPPTPVPRLATPLSPDLVRVQWKPIPNALGISIELRLADGTYRPIGIAASSPTANRADVTLHGLDGNAIRLRAWNSAGTSQPSADVAIKPAGPRQRAVRK